MRQVLTRFGHACHDTCSAADPRIGVVRFAWHNPRVASSFVVVDLDPELGPLPARRLLQNVNRCTGRDGIRVLARQPSDRGGAPSALAAPSPAWTVLA